MPSDELLSAARTALAEAGEPFRSAVGTTVQQVQNILAEHQDSKADVLEYNRAELGSFASDRIDVEKFAAVLTKTSTLPPHMIEVVDRSLTVLAVAAQMLENVIEVKVEAGSSIRDALRGGLNRLGLAFGAARVVDLAKHGEHDEARHHDLLDGVLFRDWTKSERLIAPPILLDVEGADLHAGSMAEFLDGNVKLVIVPRGDCAPASLVRLITPRTYVVQTRNPADIAPLLAWKGPGVALLAEHGIARFTHDPAGGNNMQARLRVETLPPNPKQSIGGISVRQQLEELEQLRSISSIATVAPAAGENGDHAEAAKLPSDPADKLAAWLLNQARDVSKA